MRVLPPHVSFAKSLLQALFQVGFVYHVERACFVLGLLGQLTEESCLLQQLLRLEVASLCKSADVALLLTQHLLRSFALLIPLALQFFERVLEPISRLVLQLEPVDTAVVC